MIERLRREAKAIIADGHRRLKVEIRLKHSDPTRVLGPLEIHEHDVGYEVTIDIEGLEELVRVAFRNKSRKSKDGPVSVKITSSKHLGSKRLDVERHLPSDGDDDDETFPPNTGTVTPGPRVRIPATKMPRD